MTWLILLLRNFLDNKFSKASSVIKNLRQDNSRLKEALKSRSQRIVDLEEEMAIKNQEIQTLQSGYNHERFRAEDYKEKFEKLQYEVERSTWSTSHGSLSDQNFSPRRTRSKK